MDDGSHVRLAISVRGAARCFPRGLAKLLPRKVDYSETATFLWKSLEICFDEYLNRFLARINLNPNGRIAEINLVASTVLSSDNGVRHFSVLRRATQLQPSREID